MRASEKRRTKKKSERKKCSAKKKKKLSIEKQRVAIGLKRKRDFPIFIFKDYNENVVSEQFVSDVKDILKKIKFTDRSMFIKNEEIFYKLMKEYGFQDAFDSVVSNIPDEQKQIVKINLLLSIGHLVFKELEKKGVLENYIPYNDVSIIPSKTDFIVQFNGMYWKQTQWGRIYYSHIQPKVEIDGKEWIVAFTRHAIERICDRCTANWKTYAGAGDAFAFISNCSQFYSCKSSHFNKEQDYITFFDMCSEGFTSHQYLTEVLNDYEPDKNYFYRVGYCPVGFSGKFVSAITMLTPGMRGTPEHKLLENSNLSNKKKNRFRDLVDISMNKLEFRNSKDHFEAVKWFHTNGIPQVIQLDESPYLYGL